MIEEVIGYFNIFAGLMVVAAMLSFLGGYIDYLLCLGTESRNDGIKMMEYGVTILFVLVVLLAIVEFFENHPAAAGVLGSLIVVALVAWVLWEAVQDSFGPKKEAEHE